MTQQMPSFTSIELTWPEELHAHAQMREFMDELSGCSSVNEAFVSGVEDDPDGEGVDRPDLADVARSRLRAWGPDDDAVARAFDIFAWLVREVVQPSFPSVPVHVPEDFGDSAALARALKPHAESTRDTWHDKYKADKSQADLEWAQMGFTEQLARGAEYLGYLPRRVNVTKYKPKLQRNSKPLSVCEAVAFSSGVAFLYAVELLPNVTSALTRLGHPDFLEAGAARRAREALYAAGITEFGRGLEQLAITLVRRYDQLSASGTLKASGALAAVEDSLPTGHDAVELLVESRQLSNRPIPPNVKTFVAAAEDVVGRAMFEAVAHLHSQSAGRLHANDAEETAA